MRVREYSEAIALDHGEQVEHGQLKQRFGAVLKNYLALINKQKNLVAFTASFGQASVIFAFIVQAPRFFAGAIQLGQLMQVNSAFGRVQESLSWFVDNYDTVAVWRATADRLSTFEAAMQAHAGAASAVERAPAVNGAGLRTEGLGVALPDGAALLQGAALAVQPGRDADAARPVGQRQVDARSAPSPASGPSRTGRVSMPDNAMFIPQRPYVPDGRLRDALAYPLPADQLQRRRTGAGARAMRCCRTSPAGSTTATPGARSCRAASSSAWRSPACC